LLAGGRFMAAATHCTVAVGVIPRSVSAYTLGMATRLGRAAMSIPQRVSDAVPARIHKTQQRVGVRLVTGWPQVLEQLASIDADLASRGLRRSQGRLDPVVAHVLNAVPARRAAGPSEIAAHAELGLPETLRALRQLLATGLIAQRGSAYTRPSSQGGEHARQPGEAVADSSKLTARIPMTRLDPPQ
jgi:DNA processing protein